MAAVNSHAAETVTTIKSPNCKLIANGIAFEPTSNDPSKIQQAYPWIWDKDIRPQFESLGYKPNDPQITMSGKAVMASIPEGWLYTSLTLTFTTMNARGRTYVAPALYIYRRDSTKPDGRVELLHIPSTESDIVQSGDGRSLLAEAFKKLLPRIPRCEIVK